MLQTLNLSFSFYLFALLNLIQSTITIHPIKKANSFTKLLAFPITKQADTHMLLDLYKVPIVPNESLVIAEVLLVTNNSELGNDWLVKVEQSNDVKGKKNLAKRYVGKQIRITVAPDLSVSVQKTDRIKARVTYQGDAKNGAFLLVNDEVEILPILKKN